MADALEHSESENESAYSTDDTNDAATLPNARTRKRVRREKDWISNKRKKLRNAGKMYVNSKRVVVPPRVCGSDCKCSMGCFKKIQSTERMKILEEFNNLQDFDIQNAYLHGLIHRCDPKRRYTSKGSTSKRNNTFTYYVRSCGNEVHVCLKAFCNIHGVSVKRVRNVRTKGCTTPPLDQRGKHNNRPNQIPETTIYCVKQHILSFPRQTSHYSRKSNPNRRYLAPGLNISKMHRLYTQKCDELNWPSVTESAYRKVFCESFNFAFGSPRSDTCKTCDSLNCHIKDSTDEFSKEVFVKQLEAHHDVAELGFQSLRDDTDLVRNEPDSHILISFDLQQNLPTPHINTGLVFYLRQLWVYNLGIHNVGNGNGYMCMWSENVASRGSDEVASCLLNYVQSLRVKPKHLIAYSDSCGGQNKNFYMVCFWVYVILQGWFETVDHKFLTPGHTYLPSDRDFALIEKQKREGEFYVPSQLFSLVNDVRKNNPFTVASMRMEEFKSLKSFSKNFINRKKNTDKAPLHFQKISWFRFTKDRPFNVSVRYTLEQTEEWRTWNIGRRGGNATLLSSITLTNKYHGSNPINPKKFEDLMKMKAFIPKAYHSFYDSLTCHASDSDDTDAEYVDNE